MLKANFNTQVNPSFTVLSPQQVKKIHLFSLELLERKGLEVNNEKALQLLKQAGCLVQGETVRFPASLVKRGLESVPERVVLADGDGRRTVFLEQRKVCFGVGFREKFDSAGKGESTEAETENAAKIGHAMPHMDFLSCIGQQDFMKIRKHTNKPLLVDCADVGELKEIIDFGVSLSGSLGAFQRNPGFVVAFAAENPLSPSDETIEKVMLCAQYGIPAAGLSLVTPLPKDPDQAAGGMIIGNAGILALLAIHQLTMKGSPFIMGISIGDSLVDAAFSSGLTGALGKFYNIPSWVYPMETKSFICDQQAAMESSFLIQAAAFSGINLVPINYPELEQLVMADEIIGMTQHFMKGVEISEETVPLDLIHEIGAGGHYLMADHTLKHYKGATFYPKYMNRQSFSNWENQDGKSMGEKLSAKVQAIIKETGGN